MDLRKLISEWLDVPRTDELDELSNRVDELEDLRDRLTNTVLDERPQLQYIMACLQDGSESRKVIAESVQHEFGVSRATAYRRVSELVEDFQLVRETDKGNLEAISFSSHETQLSEI